MVSRSSYQKFFYVPDINNNILSWGQFLKKGFEVQMKDKNLKIFDESRAAIASVKMKQDVPYGSYYISVKMF